MVKNLPRSLSQTDIKSILGVAGYIVPTLTQKSKKFEWSEAYEKYFQ